MSRTYDELKNMSEEELIEAYDHKAQSTVSGLNHYAAELRHRELMEALAGIQKAVEGVKEKLYEITFNTMK